MICYKDMTFCPFHATCKNGEDCFRAFTDKVKEDAERWWDGPAPVSLFADKPDCWVEK